MNENIKLRISNEKITLINMLFFDQKPNIEIITPSEYFEKNENPTLKDIAIMMHGMVGHGVTWQLAGEISKKFNLNLLEITNFLDNLFENYANISDEEAWERWDNAPSHEDIYK